MQKSLDSDSAARLLTTKILDLFVDRLRQYIVFKLK